MKRTALDINDKRPSAMVNYLSYYGWHFSKKMNDFALSMMYKDGEQITPITKEKVDELLKAYSVKITNDILYDKVYVANMLKADQWGQGIPDEKCLAKGIKAYLDDEDGYDGIAFSRFYIDTVKKGIPISWDDML